MDIQKSEDIRQVVREKYGQLAKKGGSCCGNSFESSCCGGPSTLTQNLSEQIGYSIEQMKSVPEGANMGLGCGNPVGLAAIKKGDTVLDLGAGAGFDCFLAAQIVGENGMVIGVDMTPEMISKARENARKGGYDNVEFRLGEIENLPVVDNSVDVILSNCVINLSPNKRKVFAEALRVLKPAGRIMISDIVLLSPLPEAVKNSAEAYVGCLAGATLKDEYISIIEDAGFKEVEIIEESSFMTEDTLNDPIVRSAIEDAKINPEKAVQIGKSISSIRLSAIKPV